MRFELPGYDVNYRDGRDHNTPAGKKLAELNHFLMDNGINGGIACLDEKGQAVRRYTEHVVLEIDDSVSGEKFEQIKKFVSELLRIMGATDSQLRSLFGDEGSDEIKQIEGPNGVMRFELPGYDVNYRDGRDYNTPAGKKLAELNHFLMDNGINGGIACLDEKGQAVRRYTEHVVLEIDDSVSGEELKQIKKIVSELLRIMIKKGSDEIKQIEGPNGVMRFELPGYDVNYRDGRDHDTPAGKKLAELNAFLMSKGIRGGIANLDEKGELVQRYTDNVVLEIDDPVSGEELKQIKKIASELLKIMRETNP